MKTTTGLIVLFEDTEFKPGMSIWLRGENSDGTFRLDPILDGIYKLVIGMWIKVENGKVIDAGDITENKSEFQKNVFQEIEWWKGKSWNTEGELKDKRIFHYWTNIGKWHKLTILEPAGEGQDPIEIEAPDGQYDLGDSWFVWIKDGNVIKEIIE